MLLWGPLAESTSEADGLEIQFTLDEIAPYGDYGRLGRFARFDLGAEVAREFANVRRVPVTVIHRMAGEERRFLAEPGARITRACGLMRGRASRARTQPKPMA